ncbi:response regulator [Haloarcula onubensis]|uniref:Response regulator n=1 Tax=Haloarcula onubensis TaxID=2950539 RepID=A0ABU2FIW9_9EURY|nr:response regulator [Halomicroarcula sp. S3CR25-11]MDS0280694.1 response regulator [Halomicroarcula sp. S3CR25-11]
MTTAEEPVAVLVVDDDEQWADYLASELEDAAPEFSVTVALSVNEAVVALADGAFDCVVADFRMPEIDGIQLLERLQTSRPHLPFILVTGDGSEDVAARAINAGVTDYIRKDPRVDQAPVFVTRIRQAVEHARLRTAIRESEHRYRTVTEQARDAIVVLRDDDVVFSNDRFRELCGGADSPAALFAHVHRDDHDRVRDVVDETLTDGDPGLREVRLVRPTGEVRHCELLGGAITYENDAATLLSLRDVTRRRSRERTRKRVREFNQAVQQRLVGVQRRARLEVEIAALLGSHGYDLVWLGSVDDGGVRTRATAGNGEYVARLEADAPREDHGGDPILWSARTGVAQFVPDFEALMPTSRRNDALDSGLRTGYALPLRHEDVAYGHLAVYDSEPARLDDAERSLLTEAAATVSFALHHVETQQTLTSAGRAVVEVDIESDDYYLPAVLAERVHQPAPDVTVEGTHVAEETTDDGQHVAEETTDDGVHAAEETTDDGVHAAEETTDDGVHAADGTTHVQYLSCSTDDPDGLADALGAHPSVRAGQVVDRGDPVGYRVTVAGETPESHLGAVGALVRSTTVGPGRATVTFELSSRTALQPAIDRLNEQYGPVTVRSVVERPTNPTPERYVRVDLDSLTEKQSAALEAAYHQGYFDRPRRRSAVDVAETLGITHTTYLQHLRVAQEKLFGQLYGGPNEADGS